MLYKCHPRETFKQRKKYIYFFSSVFCICTNLCSLSIWTSHDFKTPNEAFPREDLPLYNFSEPMTNSMTMFIAANRWHYLHLWSKSTTTFGHFSTLLQILYEVPTSNTGASVLIDTFKIHIKQNVFSTLQLLIDIQIPEYSHIHFK